MVKVFFGVCVNTPEGQHDGRARSRIAADTALFAASFCCNELAFAAAAGTADGPALFGIPVDFLLFALTLLGVALFHAHTLWVALTGLVVIAGYKILFTGFKHGAGAAGFAAHMGHEWVILTNLLCLLLGFALLSRHFEDSKVPAVLPKYLPSDWKGAFVLLVMVFVLSSFLDNIAAALIGGAMAHTVFFAARCISATSPPSSPRPTQVALAAWSGIPPPP